MNEFKKITLLASILVLFGGMVMGATKQPPAAGKAAMKGLPLPNMEAKIKALEARLEAAKAAAELAEAKLAALQGQGAAEEEEEAPAAAAAAATEEEVQEDEADLAAEELAGTPPADLDASLIAFAQAFKKLSAADIAAIEASVGAEFGHRHGGHGLHGKGCPGKGGPGMHHGMGGHGMHGEHCNFTLTELVAELSKPANAKVLSQDLRFRLIRWAWRINRLQDEGKLAAGPLLAQAAKVVISKAPKGGGHHEFPGWEGRGGRRGPGGWHGGPGRHGHDEGEHRGPGGHRHGGHGGHERH